MYKITGITQTIKTCHPFQNGALKITILNVSENTNIYMLRGGNWNIMHLRYVSLTFKIAFIVVVTLANCEIKRRGLRENSRHWKKSFPSKTSVDIWTFPMKDWRKYRRLKIQQHKQIYAEGFEEISILMNINVWEYVFRILLAIY